MQVVRRIAKMFATIVCLIYGVSGLAVGIHQGTLMAALGGALLLVLGGLSMTAKPSQF